MLEVNHETPKARLLKVHGFYIRQTMEHFFYAVPEAAAVVWCDFILLRGYFVIRGRHFLTSCKNQAMVHSWKAIGLEQLLIARSGSLMRDPIMLNNCIMNREQNENGQRTKY